VQAGSVAFSQTVISFPALDFGVIEAAGVLWGFDDFQGWGGPASTLQVTQKPRASGGWAGKAYLTPRVMSITGWCTAPSIAALSDANDRLQAAISLDSQQMLVVEASRSRWCNVRRQGEVLWNPDETGTNAAWSVQIIAPDGRRFASSVSQTTNLPSSSGGLTWPVTWPIVWNSNQVTGVVTLTNPGTATGPITLRINGPVTGPSITHLGTGAALTFASSLALNAGEWLDVDMEAKSVLANGQSSRNGWITSRGWFGLDPGVNQFAYNATVYSPTSTLLVTGWPTWP
jgi:hypothetical protein